jgi:hypothetical protein
LTYDNTLKQWLAARRQWPFVGRRRLEARLTSQSEGAFRKPNLIYLCAIGKAYLDMAQMVVWTIRHLGNYPWDDEILIVVDPSTFDTNEKTLSQFKEIHHVRLVPLAIDSTEPFNPMMAKVLCNGVIDFSKYDRVMYIDTDILVVNQLEGIFTRAPDKITCFEDIFPLKRRWFAWDTNMPKNLRNKLGVNTGLFCGSGPNIRNLLARWIMEHKRICLTMEPPHDQPAFNKMVFDMPNRFHIVSNAEDVEKYTYMPPSEALMECGLNQGAERVSSLTTFLHFIWMRNKVDKMAKVFDVLTQSGRDNIGNTDYYWTLWKMMQPDV